MTAAVESLLMVARLMRSESAKLASDDKEIAAWLDEGADRITVFVAITTEDEDEDGGE